MRIRSTNVPTTTSWTNLVPVKLPKGYANYDWNEMNEMINDWAREFHMVVGSRPWAPSTVHLRTHQKGKSDEIICLHRLGQRLFSRSFVASSEEGFKHYAIAPDIIIPDLSVAQIHISSWGRAQGSPNLYFSTLALLIKESYNEEARIYKDVRPRLEKVMQERRAKTRTLGVVAHVTEG